MSIALTLYEIDRGLWDLYDRRQELMDLVLVDQESVDQRDREVRSTDLAISQRLQQLDKKADGIAYVVKELETRAHAHGTEGKRLTALARYEEATAAEIKQRVADVLALRVTPEAIEAATMNTTLTTVDGKHTKIKLVKSTDGVAEPIDMSLLPAEMQRVTVTMSLQAWEDSCDCLYENQFDYTDFGGAPDVKINPDKRAILAALEQRVACEMCGGDGFHPDQDEDLKMPCPNCNGKGNVPGSVPGAHLKHGYHVRIS